MNPTPTTPEIESTPARPTTPSRRETEPRAIPPLEPGDRLTLAEFRRRFDSLPDLKRAELIEGVVSMSSPVRWRQHARPHLLISYCLAAYIAATPGVRGGDDASIEIDNGNSPQPDLSLPIDPTKGGGPVSPTMATLPAPPSWSSRSPPAPRAWASTPGSGFIGGAGSGNTWSGASWTGRWTGSGSTRGTAPCPQGPTASSGARPSPAP